MISNKYNSAYYILVSNNADSEYDQALLYFVLYVIKKKNYTDINSVTDTTSLCEEFNKLIGFNISYFAMEEILKKANKQGFLTYNKKKNTYTPDFNKIQKCPFMNKMYDSKTKFTELIKDFKGYALNSLGKELSNSNAEKIIANFIEEQGLIFYKQKEHYFNNSHDEYLFAKYLKHTQEANPQFIEYINDLIIGRISSELFLYEPKNATYLKHLNIYLDAGFIFRLLGLDSIDRKQIYQQLLDSIHACGIKTYIFSHTLNEITTIIDNSCEWINNPDFDPSIATETTYYFVTNNYKVEDIEKISIGLKSSLSDYNIEIIDIDYPQNTASKVISEATYYDEIINYYNKHNTNFDENEKKQTVELDALSFFLVDHLNKGICGTNLLTIKNLFVTTNSSLARISKHIITSIKNLPKKSIPFCVSDRFIGVLLWQADSKKITEDSYNRLIVAMNAALLPNEQILKEFSKSIDKAEYENTISEENCYFLRTNKKAHNYLMDITQGNVEEFSAKTPLEILQGIRSEAKEEGKNEERLIADKELEEKELTIKQKSQEIDSLTSENLDWQIRFYSAEKREKEEKLISLERDLQEKHKPIETIKKKTGKLKSIIYMSCFVFVMIIIMIAIILGFNKTTKDLFDVFSFVVPFVPVLIVYIVLAVKHKKISFTDWINKAMTKYENKLYKKNNVLFDEIEVLKTKILDTRKDIEKLKKIIDSLILKRG